MAESPTDRRCDPTSLRFCVLDSELAVVRVEEGEPISHWAAGGKVWAVVRVPGELTVVCETARIPPGARAEPGWVALVLKGPFPFAVTGVLAAISAPLAAAGVSIFVLSTFDTDVVLVKRAQLDLAVAALLGAGHTLVR